MLSTTGSDHPVHHNIYQLGQYIESITECGHLQGNNFRSICRQRDINSIFAIERLLFSLGIFQESILRVSITIFKEIVFCSPKVGFTSRKRSLRTSFQRTNYVSFSPNGYDASQQCSFLCKNDELGRIFWDTIYLLSNKSVVREYHRWYSQDIVSQLLKRSTHVQTKHSND